MGKGDQGGILIDSRVKGFEIRCHFSVLRSDPDDIVFPTQQVDAALQNIKIGWKIEAVGNDPEASGPEGERCGDELEEIDGDRVTDDDLAGSGTDQDGDLFTDTGRGFPPELTRSIEALVRRPRELPSM
jgi:hypothetical protein